MFSVKCLDGKIRDFRWDKSIGVFIDCQKDFISGVLGSENAKKAFKNVKKLSEQNFLRKVGTLDVHYSDYEETLEGKYLPIEHCKIYSSGCDLEGNLWDLAIKEKWQMYNKETFGSFIMAEWFNNYKFKNDLDCIVVSGFCTDICVISNVLMIKSVAKDVSIIVVEDACAGSSEKLHKEALEVMKSCHVDVVSMQDLGLDA